MMNDFIIDTQQENDEDIGALGSILSWDDEDEAGVEASVAATTNALDARRERLPTLKFKENPFMHQFSGVSSDGSDNFAPNPVNYEEANVIRESQQPAVNAAPPQQPAPPVVPNSTSQTQPQQPAPNTTATTAPVVNTQQQQQPPPMNMSNAAANQFSQMMFPMFQQPALFNPPNSQQAQAMQFGMAQMMQQQGQQPQFNKVFLQQMQQAAAQAQAQQFSMQQSRQMAAQSASMMSGLPPQPIPSMPAGVTPAPASQPKKSNKRKSTSSSAASASKRRPTVVSSSDTDCDMSGKSFSTKSTRGKQTDTSTILDTSTPIDTSNMSADEKAKANRDRNREHARNTRLRKKAYLEKLKSTVDELCRERDTLVSERAGAATLLVEMHNIRTEVLMSFFALRSANEQRRELWGSILDESFACVMPVTPYRSFLASEVQVSKCQRTVLGIDSMMADTASLHVLLNTLIDRSRFPTASIEFRYTLVTEDVVVAGNQMMARWAMSTVNAVQLGARMEVSKQGMLCAKFNSAHKIIGLELMFDVMAFMLQLKQATGQDSFSVVPNTVQTCQRSFDKPMVMTLAERPYTIVQVNKLWEDMAGYSAEEVVGKASCRLLQGAETDQSVLEELMTSVRYKRPSSGLLVNYNKNGERFRNHLTLYPLSTDSKITHYVALTTHFGPADGTEGGSAAPNAAAVASVAPQQGSSKAPTLEGQTQLMQSMMMPGPRPAPSLAPLGNTFVPAPTMPHPPLGFFPAPVAVPSAMPMGKMTMPDTKPAPSSASSTQSGTST